MGLGNRADGEAGLPNEGEASQLRMDGEFIAGDRAGQRLHGGKVAGEPLGIGAGGVGIDAFEKVLYLNQTEESFLPQLQPPCVGQ